MFTHQKELNLMLLFFHSSWSTPLYLLMAV